MKKQISAFLMSIVLIGSFMPSMAGPEEYNNQTANMIYKNAKTESLQAKAAVLMDIGSGRVLFEKNMDQKLPLASVTKVMTSILIMEALDSGKIKIDSKVPVTSDAEDMGGSQVYLKVGETFTVDEMLKAIFVHSANDACIAMADFVSGSEGVFVDQMNQKAQELGMINTKFLDSCGLTDDGHYSSARDIAIMSMELIKKHPKSIEYSTIWMDTFRDGKFRLDNTNKLVKYYNGTTGLKTGFTSKAGYCMSATAKREDMNLVAVVLGEPDSNTRFAESRKLLDYGFANFKVSKISDKGEDTGNIEILKGIKFTVKTTTLDSFSSMLKNEEVGKVQKEIRLNKSIEAPFEANTKVGEVILKLNDAEIGKVDIVTVEKCEKASFFRLLLRKIASWFGISY